MRKFIFFIITVSILPFTIFLIQKKTTPQLTSQIMKGVQPQADSSTFSAEYYKNFNDLAAVVNEQDPRMALDKLQRLMDTNQFVFKNCHSMAHGIGRTAYEKYQDFNTALEYQNTTCSNGYLHGVIEAKFASLTNTKEAITELKTICSKYIYADRCWHGTGHGLMFFTSNNLPTALSICNTYPIVRARHRCYEGVFMENFLADQDAGHPSNYINPKNPFMPCPSEKERYKGVCYFYAPIYYLNLHNNDYNSAIQWCQSAETSYITSCVRGIGSLAMKYNINNPKYAEKICETAPDRQISSCISGMVSYYLTFNGSLSKTALLCPQLESTNAKTCQTAVKRKMSLFQD